MKLLLDEMWSFRVAQQLRQRGHDVDAVVERQDLQSRSDAVIFAAACREGRAVVTSNIKDFRGIVADARSRGLVFPGVIYTPHRQFPDRHPRTPGQLVTALDALLTANPNLDSTEHWLR